MKMKCFVVEVWSQRPGFKDFSSVCAKLESEVERWMAEMQEIEIVKIEHKFSEHAAGATWLDYPAMLLSLIIFYK